MVTMASPPIRSICPRASRRSVSLAIDSASVPISWNLSVDEPTFSTRIFIPAILAGPDRPRAEDAGGTRGLEARLEKAQMLGLVTEAQPTDAIASLVNRNHAFRRHVHVRLRVDPPRNRQPDK